MIDGSSASSREQKVCFWLTDIEKRTLRCSANPCLHAAPGFLRAAPAKSRGRPTSLGLRHCHFQEGGWNFSPFGTGPVVFFE